MFNYWKRQYNSLLLTAIGQQRKLESTILNLKRERDAIRTQLDVAKKQNEMLENELQETDAKLDDARKIMKQQQTTLHDQQDLLCTQRRYINDLHNTIKVLSDVVRPKNDKKGESFPLT